MEPQDSLGFRVGGTHSQEVSIPGSKLDAGHSAEFSSAYATPQSTKQGVMSSSPPYTESPSSFHTADQLDNDYQQDANSEMLESPSSTPPAHNQFYSDGRPCPVPRDGDDESKDSFDDGGYITATQIPVSRFTDPDQPKLLLADEPVQPLGEKRPLQDGFVQPTSSQTPSSTDDPHEAMHRQAGGARKRGRSKEKPDTDTTSENAPLLPQQDRDRDEEQSSCCCIL